MLLLIFLAGLWAGTQNALAGGGSFITLPMLILAGLNPLAANMTSTIALFPGQVTTGLANRKLVSGTRHLPFSALLIISLIGGAMGGLLLLKTPADFFARIVPLLVLFATLLFAWSGFVRKPTEEKLHLGPIGSLLAQFATAIYGGYFGGGIGFLMLAALSMAGMPTRAAGATKNVLASVMNASAVAIFAFSPAVHWHAAGILCVGAIAGGFLGARLLHRINEKILRVIVVIIGLALTIGLFLRPV
jgi:hypothetical protein